MYAKDNGNAEVNASAYPSGGYETRVPDEDWTAHQEPSDESSDISSFKFCSSEAEVEAKPNAGTTEDAPDADSLSKTTIQSSKQWRRLTEEDKQSIQRWLASLPLADQEKYGVIDLDPNLYKMDRLQRLFEKADLLQAAMDAESGHDFLVKNHFRIADATESVYASREDIISWWNFFYLDLDMILYEARHPRTQATQHSDKDDWLGGVGVFDDLDEIFG